MRNRILIAVMPLLLAACSTTINTTQPLGTTFQNNLQVKDADAKLGDGVTAPPDVATKLQQAVMKDALTLDPGTTPVKLNMTITKYDLVSNVARFFTGAILGSNKLDVDVDVVDEQDGKVIGHYSVDRDSNPGGYGAFYDQEQATVDEAAKGVIAGLAGKKNS